MTSSTAADSRPLSPRALSLKLIRGAREIPREQWDALARRGYHRHAWFVAAESSGAEARHVAIYNGEELVAVIPAYLEHEAIDGDLHARWFGPAHRIAGSLGVGLRPSLAIGAPMSTSFDPLGGDDVLTEEILDEAMELFAEEARSERARAIVWPYVSDDASALLAVARQRGFRESRESPSATLEVEWRSLEAYVESRPKNINRTLRNELAYLHDSGIRISWESDFASHASTFDAFYRASYAARHGSVSPLPLTFFARLAAQHSPGIRVQCAWKGDTLLSMAVVLEGGTALDVTLRAQSDEARSALLYQHCLCAAPLRAAIAGELSRVYLGPGDLDAKWQRGARMQTRLTLVRGCTPAARVALRALAPVAALRNRPTPSSSVPRV